MKVSRHAKIVELINQYNIETQEELAEQLNKAGFQVTQATVSRDIRDLRLTKVAGENGKQKYVILQVPEKDMKEKYMRILKDGYVSMEMAQNILVVKTVSGMAMAHPLIRCSGTKLSAVLREMIRSCVQSAAQKRRKL